MERMEIIHHQTGRDELYKIWHYIDKVMIIYTYTEGGSIVFQDKLYPIKRGTLCFISTEPYFYTMPDKPEQYDRSKIFLDRETTEKIIDLIPKNTAFYNRFRNNSVVYAEIPEKYIEETERIFEEAQDFIDSPDKFICCFFRLMTYLNKYVIESTPRPHDTMSKAIEFINNNYSQSISLEDICREIHVSKYHFCRKFKENMGMSVMKYVLKTRIAAAKKLMETKEITIGEISERCGFSSISYFCQVFKENVGKNSAAYRKELQQELKSGRG